jgi:hypothetical protein
MASLSEIARQRKSDLKSLTKWSLNLNAAQEAFHREVLRIKNRKKSVPELADAERLSKLLEKVFQEGDVLADTMIDISDAWR